MCAVCANRCRAVEDELKGLNWVSFMLSYLAKKSGCGVTVKEKLNPKVLIHQNHINLLTYLLYLLVFNDNKKVN